jgi:superfamily II DNA or RNA helicase
MNIQNAFTGMEDQLEPHLKDAIDRAGRIRLIVSFIMESGAKILVPSLSEAAHRGVPIQILTGKYLSITEPSALYCLLDSLGQAANLRFYFGSLKAFHPKAYLFDYEQDAEVFIGSSNISRSALTHGVEWNYRFYKSQHPDEYYKFSHAFDELYHRYSQAVTPELLKDYAIGWKRPTIIQAVDLAPPEPEKTQPRGAQIEALYYLKQAREEGVDKGVVVAATGVGKTHLAAFDSLAFKRVLFVAHREEILKQAYSVFQSLRPRSKLGFYTGKQKDTDVQILFSTIQTLSRDENLRAFPGDFFNYIVMDEFHHAAAESYRKVLSYFKPDFLLGLTATPFRMDNQDVFLLCDDNVIYEISMKQAIERDLLVPFHYHAAYDPTDYDLVRESQGTYVVEDLEREFSRLERADLILHHYRKLAGERTIGFCVSIKHAEYMTKFFSKQGILSLAVHSGNGTIRDEAIDALKNGQIKVIFAVDIFNEGVDIPSLDTVMFLRPTESYVVFLQQLGRGLRKHPEKDCLNVIDFIGNYKRAHYLPLLLAGENPWAAEAPRGGRIADYKYPEGCLVNFDFRVIDLFDELASRDPLPVRMKDTYWRLRHTLGRRPTRTDIYQGSDIPIREYLKDGWLNFLARMEELTEEEAGWLGTPAEEFLLLVERTRLTKAYKLPTIRAFLQDGTIVERVELDRIGQELMRFYREQPLHQKDLSNLSNRNWKDWEAEEFVKLARRNPVRFLAKGPFFNYDEINQVMYLDPKLEPFLSPQFGRHIEDILEYRRIDYFRRRFKNTQ